MASIGVTVGLVLSDLSDLGLMFVHQYDESIGKTLAEIVVLNMRLTRLDPKKVVFLSRSFEYRTRQR